MTEAEMLASLEGLGIVVSVAEHEAVFTVEESAALHDRIPGVHTKNLFLKDVGGRFWLVTVAAALRVDLKALAPAMGAKKLSFGNAEAMAALLGVTPGAVTPLAACNDSDCAVTVVIDAAVAAAETTCVHPLRNTATLSLPGADLLRALARWNHPALVIAVPARAD